jgi:hypothetical protein
LIDQDSERNRVISSTILPSGPKMSFLSAD